MLVLPPTPWTPWLPAFIEVCEVNIWSRNASSNIARCLPLSSQRALMPGQIHNKAKSILKLKYPTLSCRICLIGMYLSSISKRSWKQYIILPQFPNWGRQIQTHTFKTPAWPPDNTPSSITSRQTWCCGMFGATFFVCCLAALNIARASDSDPSLSVLPRDLIQGLRQLAISRAQRRDIFINSSGEQRASIRPRSFPSFAVMNLLCCKNHTRCRIQKTQALHNRSLHCSN
jgi:hypothetical protein